jgi:hypothetical protein
MGGRNGLEVSEDLLHIGLSEEELITLPTRELNKTLKVVRNFLFNPINNYCPGLGRPTT